MPPKVKFAGGRSKHVFREAVRPIVPEEVGGRTDKMGFPVPLSRWCREAPVRDFVGDVLDASLSEEDLRFIEQAILAEGDGVSGYHRLRTRRAGQVRHRRIDRDHEIEIFNQRRGVREILKLASPPKHRGPACFVGHAFLMQAVILEGQVEQITQRLKG